ncbi:hypothetical protein C5167_037268 [Papaver somniferum]|uniref:Uncharacterized protein n=1 Tax=Papaver somniferum TaxID=3469 RepID=A0A4Y7I913_PAPSO|nr:hypothetical protein C5167_037268 [Papaver somniferum]
MLLNSEKQIQSKQRGIEVVLIEVDLGQVDRINFGKEEDKLEKGVSELRTDNHGLELNPNVELPILDS